MTVKTFWGKYKGWIIFGIIALILLPSLLRALTGNDSDEPVKIPGTGGVGPKFTCNPSAADRNKVLSQGTKNSNEVCYLQGWLNQYFQSGLKVDGNFGANTRSAVNKNVPSAGQTFSLNSIGA